MKTRAQFLTVITAIVLLGAMAIAATFYLTRPKTLETAPAGYDSQPTLGRADAPVTLVLFENFLCEHCRAFEREVFPQLQREYIDTGKVRVVYVNLAWGEASAELAALAGECAYGQDETAFWNFKSRLYEAQGSWQTAGDLAALADAVSGLDGPQLEACMTEGDTQAEVERDLAAAEQVGVSGTPSVVVGDQGFEAPTFDTLRAAIEAQLATGPAEAGS